MNNNEFVECKICKAKMKSLSFHIKRAHKITKDKYLEMFPDSELNSKLSSERRSNALRNNWTNDSYRKSHSESSKKLWTNKEFRDKISKVASDNLLNKWKDEEFRDKVSQTARNTMKNNWNSEEFRNKISSKLVEYNKSDKGRQTSSQVISNYNNTIGKEFRKKNIPIGVQEIIYDRDRFKDFLLSIPEEDRTWFHIKSKLNYYSSYLNKKFYEYNLENEVPISSNRWRSHYEDEIRDFINSVNSSITVLHNCKSQLYPYELDIYIPDRNLGIEFNGDYWHSELYKDSNYHQEKSLYAKDKNIFIYHIWEHEWNDYRKQKIIKSQLMNLLNNNSERIYARKCEIRDVSHKDSKEFLDANHLQGNRNSSIRIGLYYNNELVSLMTFGMNKFIRKNSDNIELLRFCNKLNTSVIGGASKLFKYFLDNYDYDNIVSYCNISKGRGVVYETLGFKLDKVTPSNYIWINLQSGDIKSRYQCQMKDEYNIMSNQGYIQLFDCGSYKYIYRKGVI